MQERHALLFQSEALQPQFDCEQTPIDWDHIGMIALMMAEAAHQGWRGTYRLTFRYRAQGDVMTAALKVSVWSWRLKKATPPLCISREGRMCRPIAANSPNVMLFPHKRDYNACSLFILTIRRSYLFQDILQLLKEMLDKEDYPPRACALPND